MAVLSFIALINPFISLAPTLAIPLAAYVLTPMSFTAAWAAWAVGYVGTVFMPLVQSGFKRLDTYIVRKKNGEPVSPTESSEREENENMSVGTRPGQVRNAVNSPNRTFTRKPSGAW